ncbi:MULTISPECIES: hypothetical protein [unclassified Microcoleus]|uniref:hypothetical protein n=1 Tax=unclassified Microcoleus TaxID=2642155 RepID=UPI002FD4F887
MSDLINEINEPTEFPAFANYKGKCVCICRADAKLVAATIADAERIMGIRATLKGTWFTPPEEGTELWNYATALLNDPPPFMYVEGQIVSLSKLEILQEIVRK